MKAPALSPAKITTKFFGENKTAQHFIMQITYLLLGIVASNGAVFGTYAPFGVAFVAATPYRSLIWSGAGALLGILFSPTTIGFRYVAALFAVIALRWVLSEIDSLSKRAVFAPLIAFVPLLSTGLVVTAAAGFNSTDLVNCITEALLAATGAYFFTRTISLVAGAKNLSTLSQQELACMAMTGCIVLLSFARITISDLSFGRIIAVAIVLIAAKYGGVSGGSIMGISTGIVFGISLPQFGFLAAAYAFGGLLSGLLASVGKLAVSGAFLLCSTIVLLQAEQIELATSSLYEILIGISIFMLIPKSVGIPVTALFAPSPGIGRTEGLRESVIMRLDYAGKALCDVSDSVNAVSEKLSTVYSPEKGDIFSKAVDDVCSTCGLRVYCWEKSDKVNENDFDSLAQILHKNCSLSEMDINKKYPKKCCKSREMAFAITNNYELKNSYSLAQRQLNEVRSVVAKEFEGLGSILEDLSNEFRDYEYFDNDASERVSAVFKMEGLVPLDTMCRVNKYNRMTVEVVLSDTERKQLKKAELIKSVSSACGRSLEAPCISFAPDRCRIQFSEKPVLDLQIGSSQHISGNGKLCGDCINYFCDGMGRVIVIISDGMGTGGRAAVDGNMASGILTKLVKAGLSLDCGLNIVNSALMVKSGDESLATLDVTVFDMYTGATDFLKAGAPVTFIKKGDNIKRIESASLPAGILRDIKFAKESAVLTEEDCIVMVSDGVISGGDKWLEAKIKKIGESEANQIADEIIREALDRRGDERDDDMTAIVMRTVKR